jgi:hypothetical protein
LIRPTGRSAKQYTPAISARQGYSPDRWETDQHPYW